MFPLIGQLAASFANFCPKPPGSDLMGVEVVATPLRLVGDATQERGDGFNRFGLRAKARELRMVLVSSRSSLEHFLSEQTLPPDGHQAFGIEIPRVQCP